MSLIYNYKILYVKLDIMSRSIIIGLNRYRSRNISYVDNTFSLISTFTIFKYEILH